MKRFSGIQADVQSNDSWKLLQWTILLPLESFRPVLNVFLLIFTNRSSSNRNRIDIEQPVSPLSQLVRRGSISLGNSIWEKNYFLWICPEEIWEPDGRSTGRKYPPSRLKRKVEMKQYFIAWPSFTERSVHPASILQQEGDGIFLSPPDGHYIKGESFCPLPVHVLFGWKYFHPEERPAGSKSFGVRGSIRPFLLVDVLYGSLHIITSWGDSNSVVRRRRVLLWWVLFPKGIEQFSINRKALTIYY